MTSHTLADGEARARIEHDVDSTFVVEAAAGTGKTTALVSRIVAVLQSGRTDLRRIVAVTFTELAAGEMKLRLRTALERARTDANATDEQRAHLDRALAQLEEARISTIHALCGDILRERPIEAKVDPSFVVAAEEDAARILDQAFDLWFQRVLESPPPGVRRILRRKKRGRDATGPRDTLREAAARWLERRDFPAPWRRDPFDRDREIDALVDELAAATHLSGIADRPDDYLQRLFDKIAAFCNELARREAVRGRDHDGLEAELIDLSFAREWRWKGFGKWYTQGRFTRDAVSQLRDRLKSLLDSFVTRAGADLAAHLHEELAPIAVDYERLKARAGKLDFLDLLIRTRDLVRDDATVRAELQTRFTHFFVDEFQDTDPMQAELLLLLAADEPTETEWTRARPPPGKLFLVGDPKQSIYRFRRADVALYEAVKRRLVEGGATLLYLTTSFRSAPSIQSAVNAAFAPAMLPNEQGSQAAYVPLRPFRADLPGQPALVALPVPRPYGDYGKITDWAIDESYPDAVGAYVDWLLHHSGFKVTEHTGRDPVPIEARHVCLLFKRFAAFGRDVTRPYVRALETRAIPHVLVGGRSFHAREEIGALRNALTAIEWPDDDLHVYATLRGPFFALGDDALLATKTKYKRLSPLRTEIPDDATSLTRPVFEALAILGELHRFRNRRPLADTIGRLLDATRAHAGIAIWPTGEQALANLLRVIDMARKFEASGATSFRAFVEMLASSAENGQAADAPVVEEGTDGVRIMTVHKAKGLEFPVVVLVDPCAPLSTQHPSRHVDHERRLWVERIAGHVPIELVERADDVLRRDREETLRLVYVAATRARDLLVAPVVGDQMYEGGWLSALDAVVHPHARERRNGAPAPGCPAFGSDTVLERPDRAQRDEESSVAPGEHVPLAGDHRVVWWDPHKLDLDRDVEGGVRQQTILSADEGEIATSAGERAHRAWQTHRRELLARGAEPSLRVTSVTEASHGDLLHPLLHDARTSDVELLVVPGDRSVLPRGKRFGTLVHAILAEIDLRAAHDREALLAMSALHGRLIGASAEEIEAAATRVGQALAHPLLVRAARATQCRREVPVVLESDEGSSASVVEGIIDLVFREERAGNASGACWTIVDFKTDADLDRMTPPRPGASPRSARETYAEQVLLYAAAVAKATAEETTAVLLSI